MHILLCVANPEGQEKKQETGEGYAVFRCDGIVPDQDVVGSGEGEGVRVLKNAQLLAVEPGLLKGWL